MEINENKFNMITRNYNPTDLVTRRIRKKKRRRRRKRKDNDSPSADKFGSKYGSSDTNSPGRLKAYSP